MDATTMHSISELIESLQAAHPDLDFKETGDFLWNPSEKLIHFDISDPDCAAHLLHEVSHAELEHSSYSRDIELIAMERDAWHHAKTVLGPKLNVPVAADLIEDDLDTYRDWLHARSLCPKCSQNGLQTDEKQYTCVVCRNVWSVNTAIGCALRRYNKKHAI